MNSRLLLFVNLWSDDFLNKKTKLPLDFFEGMRKFTLYEQILILHTLLSLKLNYLFNRSVPTLEIIVEVHSLIGGLELLIGNNDKFFSDMFSKIKETINNKKFKTKFTFDFYGLEDMIYFMILVYGVYFIEQAYSMDEENINDAMLHRNVILYNISKQLRVFYILGIKAPLKENCIKLLIILSDFTEVKKVIVRIKKKYKTNFYIKFNIKITNKYDERIIILYSRIKFSQLKNYLIGASHLSLCDTIKKSNWQVDVNTIDTKPLLKLSQQEVDVDFSSWPIIVKHIRQIILKEHYIPLGGLQNMVSVSSLIDGLLNQKAVYLQSIKKKKRISRKKKDLKAKIANQSDDSGDVVSQDIELELLISENINKEELTSILLVPIQNYFNKIKLIDSTVQKLYYLIICEKLQSIKKPIYIAHYYDFRGRIYPNSSIGFTYLKMLRASYRLKPTPSLNESIFLSKYYSILQSIDIEFPHWVNYYCVGLVDEYYMKVLFLELGKLIKPKNLTYDRFNLQQLIVYGLELYSREDLSDLNTDDLNYALQLKECLAHFFKTKIWLDITIIRDSTASSLQHWGVNLGIQDNYLNCLNLRGNEWYDVYTIVINLFLEYYPHYKTIEFIKPCLNRKTLKILIMVSNYNAGTKTCLGYLVAQLKQDSVYDQNAPYEEFVNDFHKFNTEQLFTIMFKDSKDSFLLSQNYLLKLSDATINLAYLASYEKNTVIKINNIRWIFYSTNLSSVITTWKTDMALNANIIQANDGELARYLVKHLNIWTVHDSFGVSLSQLHRLMDHTNKFFNLKLNSATYGLFILI